MFIITTEDNKVLVEGRDVASWLDVPTDIMIKSVTLTDGLNMGDTLSECDFYICCYSAYAVCASNGGSGNRNTTDGQLLYGIRLPKRARVLTQKIAGEVRAKIEGAYGGLLEGNIILSKARGIQMNSLKDKVEKVLSEIENSQVSLLSLGFSKRLVDIKSFTQDKTNYRSGLPKELGQKERDHLLDLFGVK